MDDCSPDDTPEIAQSFKDCRVKHIRNKSNIGHLRNYNKGISLARGQYVWLVSADDRLRKPYILERYLTLISKHPEIGYLCCPGIGLENGVETTVLDCGYYGPRDRIFNGRQFIATSLRKEYGLLAPSVMVRKDCYEKISAFPLDMPHQGDWYLWFRWALEYDVAYLCEPMVNYRFHDLNIMKHLLGNAPATVFGDEVRVLWRTKEHCKQKGYLALAETCEYALALKYARAASSAIYADTYSSLAMTIAECERALLAGASNRSEYERLHGKFEAYLGDAHWRNHLFARAQRSYALALRENWKMPEVWLKTLILCAGFGRTALLVRKLKRRMKSNVSLRGYFNA
jgi:glycosyltransferase involved in cell wall biosynthesis